MRLTRPADLLLYWNFRDDPQSEAVDGRMVDDEEDDALNDGDFEGTKSLGNSARDGTAPC